MAKSLRNTEKCIEEYKMTIIPLPETKHHCQYNGGFSFSQSLYFLSLHFFLIFYSEIIIDPQEAAKIAHRVP